MFVRMLAAVMGGLVMFAAWLAAVLAGMPRPPVPPSFAVSLAGAFVVAAGFAAGMFAAERFTGRRRTAFGGLFLWTAVGCAVGATLLYPFGGMMAGFGMLGLGPAVLLVRELLLLRDELRHRL